jgi:hypothetical protein
MELCYRTWGFANPCYGEFTEGHELDPWKVAKEMVGRRLSQEEAKRWLG